jgi:hypothetical protein
MPLTSVSAGEVFTVRVYKVFNLFRYANTYEIVAQTSETNSGEVFWRQIADRFASLESQMLLNFIQVDRIVISSYVPDGQPYNPNSFISLPYSIYGQTPIVGDIVPANMCMVVRKNVTYGRDGRNFYRGTMNEGDLVGGFPEGTLSDTRRNNIQNLFNVWYTDLINNTIFSVCLASGTPTPSNVRVVTDFVVERRVASKKTNNRYFKRNPGVPGGGD